MNQFGPVRFYMGGSSFGGGQSGPPTLRNLLLSSTSLETGVGAVVNILRATDGSTITLQSGSLPNGMSLNSAARTIVGTPTVAADFSFTLREVLDGATNTPHDTAGLSISVAVGPPTLGTLTLSSGDATQGNITSINILGATGGSTLTVYAGALPDGLALDSDARTIAGTPTTVDSYSFTLREVLAGATNTPHDTAGLAIDVAAAGANPIIAYDPETETYSITSDPGTTQQWYYTSVANPISGATSATLTHAAAIAGGALGNVLFAVINGDTAHPSNALYVYALPTVYADANYEAGTFDGDFYAGVNPGPTALDSPWPTLGQVVPAGGTTDPAFANIGYSDTGSTHDVYFIADGSLQKSAIGDMHGFGIFQGDVGSGGYEVEHTVPLASLVGSVGIPFGVAANNYGHPIFGDASGFVVYIKPYLGAFQAQLIRSNCSDGASQAIAFTAAGPNLVFRGRVDWGAERIRVFFDENEPASVGLYTNGEGMAINDGGSPLLTESGTKPGMMGRLANDAAYQPPLDIPLVLRTRYLELLPSYFSNLTYSWDAPEEGVGALLSGSVLYVGTMANIEYAIADTITGSVVISFAAQVTNGDGTADFSGIDFAAVPDLATATLIYRDPSDHTKYGSHNLGAVPDRRAPRIGVNMGNGSFVKAYGAIRPFVDLSISRWEFFDGDTPAPDPSVYCDVDLNPIEVPVAYPTVSRSIATLLPDNAVTDAVNVTLTYDGDGLTGGHLSFAGINVVHVTNGIATADIGPNADANGLRGFLSSVNPADPIRNMRCVETVSPPTGTIYQGSVDLNERFNILRLMDMQNTNANATVTLANRSKTTEAGIFGPAGYPIELLVAYANACQSNPWFCVPWNADDDYIQFLAEYIRDNLDPGLVAYIENSNEVWNFGFPVTAQAYLEGLDLGISLRQVYAIRFLHIAAIFETVFSGQMERIVRVQAGQAADSATISDSMAYMDSYLHTDAIACAPYMFLSAADMPALSATPTGPELTAWFAAANPGKADAQIANWLYWRNLADSFPGKKRLLSYEDGGEDYGYTTTQLLALQNDSRMGDLWDYFYRAKTVTGDVQCHLSDLDLTFGLLLNQYQSINDQPKSEAINQLMIDIGQIV